MKTISVNRSAIFYSIIFGLSFAVCILIWIINPTMGNMQYGRMDTVRLFVDSFGFVIIVNIVHLIDSRRQKKGKVRIEKEDERYSLVKLKAHSTSRYMTLVLVTAVLILSLYFEIEKINAYSLQLLLLTIISFDMFADRLLMIYYDKHFDGEFEV